MGGGCGQGMCTLNPRGRLAVGPRTTLKEIPLYEIPGAVHPKPVLVCVCVRVCVCVCVCVCVRSRSTWSLHCHCLQLVWPSWLTFLHGLTLD